MEGLPSLPSNLEGKCRCLIPKTPEEDPRLKKWKEYQNRVNRVREHISYGILRPQKELLMSRLNQFRELQEQRTLIACANISCRFDKYRGNPRWWVVPPKLGDKCNRDQEYYVTWNTLERHEIPKLEYITMPSCLPEYCGDYHGPQRGLPDYALKRLDSLCVRKIEPHRPSLHEICIIGKKVDVTETRPSQNSYFELDGSNYSCQVPTSTFSGSQASHEKSQKSITFLELNDQIVKSDSTGIIKTSVYFDAICGEPTKIGYLYLQNTSTWSLRISFKDIKVAATLGANKKAASKTFFYYDRNYKVIVPGEKKNIPFWFKSSKCGFYDTLLKMTVVPDLWDNKLILQISLNGSSIDEGAEDRAEKYEKMIQDRARYRMINECLHDWLKDLLPKESNVKMYTYNKKTIFEALNSNFTAFRTSPKYVYIKEIVDELEEFYTLVRLEKHPEYWSLVLDDLRAVTKDREVFDKVSNMVTSYETILEKIHANREARVEMQAKLQEMFMGTATPQKAERGKKGQKPAKAPKPPKASKPKAVKASKETKKKVPEKVLMIEAEREEVPKRLSDHLEEIIAKLESSAVFTDYHCQILKSAYNLFCGYIDKISFEVKDMCQNYFSLERLDSRVVYRNAFNLGSTNCFQMAAPSTMATQAFGTFPKIRGKAQPAWALEIPMQDFEERYQAREQARNPEGDKKGKVTKDKDKKEKGSAKSQDTKKTPKSKPDKSRESTVNAGSISKLPQVISEEEEYCEDLPWYNENWYFLIPPDKVDQYRNNIYTCFYQNLCDFVDDLSDILVLVVNVTATPAEIHTTTALQMKNLTPDQGLQMQCVNLREKISQLLIMEDADEDDDKHAKTLSYPGLAGIDDVHGASASVWDIVKAYVPKRFKKVPLTDEEIYALRLARMLEVHDAETEVTPEEPIIEKNLQTDLCGDIEVSLSDGLLPGDDKQIDLCVCGREVRTEEVPKLVSSFHDSLCYLSTDKSVSSPDISSSDT